MKFEKLKTQLYDLGLSEKDVASIGKFPYFDEYKTPRDFLTSFTGIWLQKHPGNKRTVLYLHEALDTRRLQWEDFTAVNMTTFRNYMQDKASPNSLRTYFAQIKAIVKPFADDGIITCKDTEKILRSKKVPADKIALNVSEVNMFWEFRNQLSEFDIRYQEIWHDFMLCTYLGCRHSDLAIISPNNITTGKDLNGNDVGIIEYTSVKTKVKAYPPLHPNVLELLKMPRSNKEYANCTSERILKDIARIIGINQEKTLFTGGKRVTAPKWKFMSTHTARHTYVTLLAGGKNPVPITEIAKYCGHTSTQITYSYIVKDEMPFTSSVIDNFTV